MSRCCDLISKKRQMVGNNVSNSNRKTKRRYHVNLHDLTFFSLVLKHNLYLKVAANTLRTIDKKGGIDGFLMNTSNTKLSLKAKKIKKTLIKRAKAIEEIDTKFSESADGKAV